MYYCSAEGLEPTICVVFILAELIEGFKSMIKLATEYIFIPSSRINLSTAVFRIFIDTIQTKRNEIKKHDNGFEMLCFLRTT